MAQVTVKGLTNTQANALSILAENSELGDFINDYLSKVGSNDLIPEDSVMPDVRFDEDNFNPYHEIEFNQ